MGVVIGDDEVEEVVEEEMDVGLEEDLGGGVVFCWNMVGILFCILILIYGSERVLNCCFCCIVFFLYRDILIKSL